MYLVMITLIAFVVFFIVSRLTRSAHGAAQSIQAAIPRPAHTPPQQTAQATQQTAQATQQTAQVQPYTFARALARIIAGPDALHVRPTAVHNERMRQLRRAVFLLGWTRSEPATIRAMLEVFRQTALRYQSPLCVTRIEVLRNHVLWREAHDPAKRLAQRLICMRRAYKMRRQEPPPTERQQENHEIDLSNFAREVMEPVRLLQFRTTMEYVPNQSPARQMVWLRYSTAKSVRNRM